MDSEKIGTIVTESIRSQLASHGFVVRRTGYCKKTTPAVYTKVEGDIVEVYHRDHWDVGRWEIHGDYGKIPKSYFDKFSPLLDKSNASNQKAIYYFVAERTKTYSSVAGDLLLALDAR
jgi:hypothetical protein